ARSIWRAATDGQERWVGPEGRLALPSRAMRRRAFPSILRPGIARLLWLLPACSAPLGLGCSGATSVPPAATTLPPAKAEPPSSRAVLPAQSAAYEPYGPEDL